MMQIKNYKVSMMPALVVEEFFFKTKKSVYFQGPLTKELVPCNLYFLTLDTQTSIYLKYKLAPLQYQVLSEIIFTKAGL